MISSLASSLIGPAFGSSVFGVWPDQLQTRQDGNHISRFRQKHHPDIGWPEIQPTDDWDVVYGPSPNSNGNCKTSFNLEIRLNDAGDAGGYKYLNIQLPLDENGKIPSHTKYVVDSNKTVSAIGDHGKLAMNYENSRFSNNLQYPLSLVSYPNGGQNHGPAEHWISMAVEIDSLNLQEHTLSGLLLTNLCPS